MASSWSPTALSPTGAAYHAGSAGVFHAQPLDESDADKGQRRETPLERAVRAALPAGGELSTQEVRDALDHHKRDVRRRGELTHARARTCGPPHDSRRPRQILKALRRARSHLTEKVRSRFIEAALASYTGDRTGAKQASAWVQHGWFHTAGQDASRRPTASLWR